MYIETERLILRRFELRDEQDLCAYMLQRVDEQFECYPDFTAEKSAEEIAARVKSTAFIAIELKETQRVIGNIYLGVRDFNGMELGYVLNREAQGRGFGSEAARAAVDWAFAHGVHRVYAECAPENTASWRLLEKLGMRREGHLRKNATFHSDENGRPIYWDTYIYALLNSAEQSE